MHIQILNHSSKPVPRQFLKSWVQNLAKELKKMKVGSQDLRSLELVLVFVEERQGRDLNYRFRGKKKATDVLSFAPIDPESLGELVLCTPVLERQAKEHGLSYRVEVGYMVLHGVLHLLGYEHEQGGAPAKEMYRIQDQVFARLQALC